MIDSYFLESIIRKKSSFLKILIENSYQNKSLEEKFLLWAKIRLKVFHHSKIEEINSESISLALHLECS